MSGIDIASTYAHITRDLSAEQISRLWPAVLFGRKLDDADLADRAKRLNDLRNTIGIESAARKNEWRG